MLAYRSTFKLFLQKAKMTDKDVEDEEDMYDEDDNSDEILRRYYFIFKKYYENPL